MENSRTSTLTASLVEVKGYSLLLQYDVADYGGATQKAYLHEYALEKLDRAQIELRKISTLERRYEILIWDAYRTVETQREIFDRYASELRHRYGVSQEEAHSRALQFVNSPDRVFPHGTGGTVDLTLLINGAPANMGTGFDEFVEKSQKDWYRNNQPDNKFELEASQNREILRAAMESAGFHGLDSEWWHYEWGTKLWAEATAQHVILGDVLIHKEVQPQSPAYLRKDAEPLPVLHTGVAQVFHSSKARSSALLGDGNHYYSRKSHPTVTGLGNFLSTEIVRANYVSLVSSGFNAAKVALCSVITNGTVLIFDQRSYYEIGNEVALLAEELGCRVVYADFTNVDALGALLESLDNAGPIVLYFDSPINWWLTTVDLTAIGKLKTQHAATALADITLDPVQTGVLKYVDIAVMSLSKYPSTGFTLGGAIYTNDERLNTRIEATIGRSGSRLNPDTAMTIWSQAVTLADRFLALGLKSSSISRQLGTHPLIRRVHTVGSGSDIRGGVVILELPSRAHASVFEKIVAQNTVSRFSNLHLAYTFGGALTTLEHFHSNPRPSALNTGLLAVPDSYVRIGLGYEKVDKIVYELRMALELVASIGGIE